MKIEPQSLAARLLLTLFMFVLFVPTLPAQKVGDDDAIDKEQAEVRAFVDSFLHDLDESKDIDQMSKNYFVSDFHARFAKDEPIGQIDKILFEQLNDEERYQLNRLVFNVGYSAIMHLVAQTYTDDYSDDWDLFSIDNMFSSQILGMMRNSKILRAIYFQDEDEVEDFSFKSVEQVHDFMVELRDVNYAQRISINDWSSEQLSTYKKNLAEFSESAYWYTSEICQSSCDGFPEKTQIFRTRGYPLEFGIVREDGVLKIYKIYPAAID